MAVSQIVEKRPPNFERWVGAAFLRLLGNSQNETAAAIGVSERSIRRWEASPDWPKAIEEADRRWLKNLDGMMRRGMRSTVSRLKEDIIAGRREAYDFIKWYAERRWPEFAPPARRLQAELLERRQYIVGAVPAGLIRRSSTSEDESPS
jgi:hypothetical protein